MKKQSLGDISPVKDMKIEIKKWFLQSLQQIISKPPSVFGYEYDIQSAMDEIRMSLDDYLKLCLNGLSRQIRSQEEQLLIHGYLFFMKDFTSMLMKVDKKSFNDTLYTVSSHIGYEHVEKDKVLFRLGEKGRKAFIILKGSISILISKSIKMKILSGDYIRYIANLLRYKEYSLINMVLNENYPIFPVEIIESADDKIANDYTRRNQRKKSRLLQRSSKEVTSSMTGTNQNGNEGPNNDEDKPTLFRLDQKNQSLKGIMEDKAKLFTVDELLSFYDKETKWKEMNIASNANADEYIKRINTLHPLNENSITSLNKDDIIEIKVFSYVNILSLGTGSFFGDLALRNPYALRTASIITNSECFFGTLNTNTYNTSLKAGAEKQRRQNVNFILSIQLFSSINHHIFQKKYFNSFTLGKCEKGTFLLEELEKPQWIFLLKEGSFEVTVKASLHELTKLIKYYFSKLPEEAIELSKLQADERNMSHLLSENKKLDKLYHEKRLIRITEVTPPEVAGLGDYLNEKGVYSFSLECKSPKGEYYQISNFFYQEMVQKDISIKLNEKDYLQKKYLFLIKRMLTIRKSTIMLLCGHKKTFINEQISQELEEETSRLNSMKRMFDFKKIKIDVKNLKLKLPNTNNNTKLRINTEFQISSMQEKEKEKEKDPNVWFSQNIRNPVLTPSIIKTRGSNSMLPHMTTNDFSNKKNREKEKDKSKEKNKKTEENDLFMELVPFSNRNEKVMSKPFNGRVEITRERNYFTKREISIDHPINQPIQSIQLIQPSESNINKQTSKNASSITRNMFTDQSMLNQFNLTEMIWENVKPSFLLPVCETETSYQSPPHINNNSNSNSKIYFNQSQNAGRHNFNRTINLKKKIINNVNYKHQLVSLPKHKNQINKYTVFLMRMTTKDKDIVDIGKYKQMKLEDYIERRNLYFHRDNDRVNFKIGGKVKNRSKTVNRNINNN